MAENDLATAERRLNEAKVTFNIACLALTSALTPFNAREWATDKLLELADLYGVDHAIKQLGKEPEKLAVPGPLSSTALSSIQKHLETAHEASERLDIAMAAREDLLLKQNRGHAKAVMLDGREAVYDPKTKSVTDRISHAVTPTKARTIDTADYDNDTDRH